ncbi:MAG: type II toxin-antitoxin system RelE/ParE family toxin [Alphaproteobacteria bacterium]|nr:type II toxin-antitoxin system RelE/ParE family toxin [Alphaproteobacteria bacterium]
MAEEDLLGMYDYIAGQSGRKVAGDYIARIESACMSLQSAPLRGTPRDDVVPGLRIVGFERRAAIAFQVKRSEVVILRTFYGGRDYERILRDSPDE